MTKLNSTHILDVINSPEKITSVEHMNELINSSEVLTLIEKNFFVKIKSIVEEIMELQVEGDLVFIGTFKGGGALYLKALFEELGFKNNCWLFDSFEGFNNSLLNKEENQSINLFTDNGKFFNQPTEKSVQKLFKDYCLDSDLQIVNGFIEDSFSKVAIEKIAFLHLDLDIYSSTLFALEAYYPKISKNGWVVIDDYFVKLFQCKLAVDKFREKNHISNPMTKIGNYPSGWRV